MTRSLVGKVFDRLTVTEFSHRNSSNAMAYYNCLCSCGQLKIISHGNLQSGHTKSCGCLRVDKARLHRTHGFTCLPETHKTYKAWCKIKERCTNTNCIDYINYGAKGIRLDDFFSDFMNFYNELGDCPDDNQNWSVDRINHKKNYEPGNLRWATDTQQARNKGKMKNNASGVTGVCWEDKTHPNGLKSTTYAISQWAENNKTCKKSFSVKKYGLLPAFALAYQYRKDQIARLNTLGYGYSDNHGQ